MPDYVCELSTCQKNFRVKACQRTGPHVFCSRGCYLDWRKANCPIQFDREERKREYASYKRLLWGGSGYGAKEVGPWARKFGRKFELIAEQTILPAEGFTDIHNWAKSNSAFFVDFVATKNGERVLIDATIKWAAHIPSKVKMADSLGMRLFELHISPADPTVVYWLREMPRGSSVSKVPMKFFHRLHKSRRNPITGWPDADYLTRRGEGARGKWSHLVKSVTSSDVPPNTGGDE